jgi:hypothetical protein
MLPTVRLTGILMSVFAVAGAVAAGAALFGGSHEARQCAAAALIVLAGYTAAAPRPAGRRTRWFLTAAIVLLATATILEIIRPDRPDLRFTDSADQILLVYWHDTLTRGLIAALVRCGALVALAVAVLGLPPRSDPRPADPRFPARADRSLLGRRFPGRDVPRVLGRVTPGVPGRAGPRWIVVASAVLAVVVVAMLGLSLADHAGGAFSDGWRLPSLLWGTLPAVAAAVLAASLAIPAAQRADARLLLPIGVLVLAAATASDADHLAQTWSSWSTWQEMADNRGAFGSASAVLASVVPGSPSLEFEAAFSWAIALAGPALAAIGVVCVGLKSPDAPGAEES